MKRGVRAVLLFALLAASAGQSALAKPRVPRVATTTPVPAEAPFVMRIGYTSWENARTLTGESAFESFKWYLEQVGKPSPDGRRQLRFEVATGNYYQILAWFRAGVIDAAIVSPFSAFLLERDGQALSVLEFTEGLPGVAAAAGPAGATYDDGHDPLVLVSPVTFPGQPAEALEEYLRELLKAAKERKPGREIDRVRRLRQRFRFDLVTHLSSSGFVMPTLYVDQWLRRPERGELTPEVKRRFWRRFFENAHLTLVHGNEPAPSPLFTIRFKYGTGKPPDDDERAKWKQQIYRVDTAGPKPGPLRIPNDVLVLRRSVATEVLAASGFDRASLGELLANAELRQAFCRRSGTYSGVRWFDPQTQGAFRNAVHELLTGDPDGELVRLDRRWYRSGLFDFTVGETMGLLRQDQLNSGVSRLALVLSGGGVKSLYQTVLLDHLYGPGPGGPRQLRNYDEGPDGIVGVLPTNEAKDPLTVHTLIGTSGGAMLAFFAAQLPEVEALQEIVGRTAQRRLFPLADLPRLFSLLVLLAVVYAVLLVARIFDLWQLRADSVKPVKKDGTARVVVIGILLVVAGALAIVATRSEFSETVPWTEGLFYVLTGVVVHFCLTCIVRAPGLPPCHAQLARVSVIGMAFGMLLVAMAVGARHPVGPAASGLHELPLSTLASAGVFLIAAGVASGAVGGRWQLRVLGVHDYGMAWIAVGALVLLPLGVLALLAWVNVGTLLELTGRYWASLVVAASAFALAVARYSQPKRTRAQRALREGLVQLMRQREGVVTTTLGSTMLGVFALCIVCWGGLVAPAVYSNTVAVLAFNKALRSEQLAVSRFHTNLVVTGTLLSERECVGQEAVPEGGLYFCFEGAEGCGLPALKQWQVFPRPAARRAVDAVFASGSAFPVFPPHRAHLPNGCEVHLIDGGYAHNVPLEAAAMARARQVLILNASPDPLSDDDVQTTTGRVRRKLQLWGQLVRSSPELLSFMFARAQDLDRSIGGDMLVASLTPRPDPLWPFLLDFRKAARDRVVAAAKLDVELDQRIGSVLSWGRPVMVPLQSQEIPPLIPAPEELAKKLPPAAGPRHAAFDLDNTSLRGDIGDALLLKLVVEMAYHGESEELWSLFANPAARRELRSYWQRFHATPKRPYARPADWSAEFTDYVVLFLRQYEQLLAAPDGARTAYPWVVKLMAGMTADDVNRHLEQLWVTEMKRPETPVVLSSPLYGTYIIDGGIRVRREIRQSIAQLQEAGWEVWIVTASNVYAGRYAARAFGVPADHVLGIVPLPEGGGSAPPEGQSRLSMEIAQPVPYREGKVAALRAHGVRPTLAAGDSYTDFEMLEDAEVAMFVDRGKIPADKIPSDWIKRAPGSFRSEVYDPSKSVTPVPPLCEPPPATPMPATPPDATPPTTPPPPR